MKAAMLHIEVLAFKGAVDNLDKIDLNLEKEQKLWQMSERQRVK